MTMAKKAGSAIGRLSQAASPAGSVGKEKLLLIGAASSTNATITPAVWTGYTPKEGDLILLFSINTSTNAAVATPAGYTAVGSDAAGTAERVQAFSKLVDSSGAIGAVTVTGANRTCALIYRNCGGVGLVSPFVGSASATHNGVLSGATKAGSLGASVFAYGNNISVMRVGDRGWNMPGGPGNTGLRYGGVIIVPLAADTAGYNETVTMGASLANISLSVELLQK